MRLLPSARGARPHQLQHLAAESEAQGSERLDADAGNVDTYCPWVPREAERRGSKFIAMENATDNVCTMPATIMLDAKKIAARFAGHCQ